MQIFGPEVGNPNGSRRFVFTLSGLGASRGTVHSPFPVDSYQQMNAELSKTS